MACMKLGSKPDVFILDGQSWYCSTGLPSDVIVEVGDTQFHLHKFPLLSRSGFLESLIAESGGSDSSAPPEKCVLRLHKIPGGSRAFLLAAKFCYGVKIKLGASDAAGVRCAAEYLQMTDEYGDPNLISLSESLLNESFASWTDSLKVLASSEELIPCAEDLHVVSRCLNSLALKACAADPTLFGLPLSLTPPWNGIGPGSGAGAFSGAAGEDWWFDDVASLSLPLYKRFVAAVEARGMRPEKVSGSVMRYAERSLGLSSAAVFGSPATATAAAEGGERRKVLEELAGLLPEQKGATPAGFLLRMLRAAIAMQCGPACRGDLERRVGEQLDRAELEDLLVPSVEYTADTLYDVDCVRRILDHFMAAADGGQIVGSGGGSGELTPITMVAGLMDGFLAEVAPDPNLKLAKFLSLAAVVPEYARPLDDGIYRAVDIYLKAHQWLTDSEREQVCRLMNCQKLSLEASTHAAQNERLPLRVIVQVLFFEQLRLRTSVAGWFFVSDTLDTTTTAGNGNSGTLALSQHHSGAAAAAGRSQIVAAENVRDRVSALEKECLTMKGELEKIVKTRGGWNLFLRRIGFRLTKPKPSDVKPKPKPSPETAAAAVEDRPLADDGIDGDDRPSNGEV